MIAAGSAAGYAAGTPARKVPAKAPAKVAAKTPAKSVQPAKKTQPAAAKAAPKPATVKPAVTRKRPRVTSRWGTPTFADPTAGDSYMGEDLTVRRAAVDALGHYNGAVVVSDPSSGRILSMVNQKLALTGAYKPCSTIKLVTGLAALSEGLVERYTPLPLTRRLTMNLTIALAKSNNPYFSSLGEKLGFERVAYYARLFGLGERAGLDIEGESAGVLPAEKTQGLSTGNMSYCGEGIGLTALQLTAMMNSIANGGTLFYLQYPRNTEEALSLTPKVKRQLDIQAYIPEIRPGMMGAVDFGTARRASYDINEPILGKTGTCTDGRSHLGWFSSFNDVGPRKLVVTVLLTGGSRVNGPVASGIAGQVYRSLSSAQYFSRVRLNETVIGIDGDN